MSKEEKITLLLEKFRKEIDKIFIGTTPKLKGEMDRQYICDIYIFRHPGMGNSKQIIVGDEISILTATTSYLEILLEHKILDEKKLKKLVKMLLKHQREK